MTAVDPLLISLILGITSAFLGCIVAVIWWVDRYDREPVWLVVAVAAWGGIASPFLVRLCAEPVQWIVSGVSGGSPDPRWLVIGVAPLVEELLKGLGILLVIRLTREFDNPTDGVVYGTAVGLGFAVTENLVYALAGVAQDLTTPVVVGLVVRRTLYTAGVHALSSSAVGAGLGFARLASRRWRAGLWTLLGFLGAVVLHGGWNLAVFAGGPDGGPPPWALIVPLYVVFAAGLGLLLQAEHLVLRRQMAEEVRLGVVPAWAAEVIPYYRRRIRSDWWPSRRERTIIARQLTRLAFRKHALSGADSSSIEGLEIVRLRQKVQRILNPPKDDTDPDELR
jgi:RsiW-degrading membrane proteinase PrsW (M82 family)